MNNFSQKNLSIADFQNNSLNITKPNKYIMDSKSIANSHILPLIKNFHLFEDSGCISQDLAHVVRFLN